MGLYMISCPTCNDSQKAKLVGESYMCLNCFTLWDTDIQAYDIDEVEGFRKSFLGAKIAGMIPEKEFEGDREQMKRERW